MRALHRPLVPLLALVLATLAFAACQESGFDERKETARPLKVQHFRGESKVPGQADAPATLSMDATDDALALGVKPVLATAPHGELPSYLRRRGRGLRVTPPVKANDLAPVEAADPDVILDDESGGVGLYTRLITIAPTVITAGGGAQWKLNVRLVGEALGRTNDAEAMMNRYDRRVAEVRRAIGGGAAGGGPAVAVLEVASEGEPSSGVSNVDLTTRTAKADSFAATILADAGVKRAKSVRTADVVLLADSIGRSGASLPPARKAVLGLAGSAAGIEEVDPAVWFGPGGVLAARAALTELERALRR